MAWTWEMTEPDEVATDEAGGEPRHGAPTAGFASQADAESWLGQVWRELAEHGVAAVSLYEDERRVYGPMSLEAG